MKRLFFFLTAALLSCSMMALDYNLSVAGVQVTSDNRRDILGDGTVKFDPSTNILTLNNAHITTTTDGIWSNRDLIIECTGENIISTTGSGGIGSAYKLTITGSGTLTINVTGTYGVGITHADSLNLDHSSSNHLYITINAPRYGIIGSVSNSSPSCGVRCNTWLSISSVTNECVSNESYFILPNPMKISSPAGAAFNQSRRTIVGTNGGAVYQGLEVIYNCTQYDIYVCGIRVNSLNKDSILGNSYVRYYPERKELRISTDLTSEHTLVEINGDGYTIVTGCRTLTCTDATDGNPAIKVTGGNLRMACDCSSTPTVINSVSGPAISVDGNLMIQYLPLVLTSTGNSAIVLTGNDLYLEGGNLKIVGNNIYPDIVGCNSLTLNTAYFFSDHTYNSTTHQFLNSNGSEAKNDMIFIDAIKRGDLYYKPTTGGYAVCKHPFGPNEYWVVDVEVPESINVDGEDQPVVAIFGNAFAQVGTLKRIKTPNSVTRIVQRACYQAYNLEEVDLGNNVTNIGELAFNGTKIKTFTIRTKTPPTLGSSVFSLTQINSATLYVPRSAMYEYSSASQWRNFGTILPLDDTAIESVEAEQQVQKVLEDGQLVIIRNGIRYDILGRQL